MKVRHWKQKLLLAAGYLVLLAVLYRLQVPCVFAHFLHIPCPGCGMTRAWLAALRLDLGAALAYHPMFWSVPLIAVYLWRDGGLFRQKWANTLLLVIIGAGFLIQWIMRLIYAIML